MAVAVVPSQEWEDQVEAPSSGASVQPGGAANGLPFFSRRAPLDLVSLWKEDWRANGRRWTRPGFHAIAVQRLGAWRLGLSRPAALVVGLAYWPANLFIRNICGIEIYDTTRLGRRVHMPHGNAVLDYHAEVGDGCVLGHNIVIGQVMEGRGGAPRLGAGVKVSAGAIILGPVTIGDAARIGPNTVVLTDVPPEATVFAATSKTMLRRRQGDSPEQGGS